MSPKALLCRSNNLCVLGTGVGQYMTTLFEGESGWYWGEYGEELFHAIYLETDVFGRPIYEVDFGDEVLVGPVKDHGFNIFLGKE